MKKIIITLSILSTLSIAGVLYATQGQSNQKETVTLEQVYKSQYPVPMPEVSFTVNNVVPFTF